jgi:hypothetical protein
MRFSVAALLLGVSTVVSALPIAYSTSSLELEGRESVDVSDMFERGFDEPATVVMYPRTKYQVALHRSKVNTPDEHWAVQFHPQNKAKTAVWHVVHATSNNVNGKGVLETEHLIHGTKDDIKHGQGYDPALQGPNHHILGNFRDHESAKAAVEKIKQFKCTDPYPGHNCVDFTKQAIDHLHAEKHIGDTEHEHFTKLYNDHKDTVRENTNTADNRKNTWGKPASGEHK